MRISFSCRQIILAIQVKIIIINKKKILKIKLHFIRFKITRLINWKINKLIHKVIYYPNPRTKSRQQIKQQRIFNELNATVTLNELLRK